jgi:hypothetical protein
MSWGEPGSDPGQFNIPHNIWCDTDGWVYVADRENMRVQVFDGNGKYEAQWNNMHRCSSLDQDGSPQGLFYIGEIGPAGNGNRYVPNIGPRISIFSKTGEPLARLGALSAGDAPDRFVSPHGLGIDSLGDIYVGEVAYSQWYRSFPDKEVPNYLHTLRKLVRIA